MGVEKKYLSEAKLKDEEMTDKLRDISDVLSVEEKDLWRNLNTLQHKDRYESEDYEDERFYKTTYVKVSNMVEAIKTLHDVYEKRVLLLKKRYK